MEAGLILQHEPSGPPARLAEWLGRRSIPYELRMVSDDGLPPAAGAYPWICALGSDQTPDAPGSPDWVDAEIAFLGEAIAADTPVLGLCFGGQALASAAGARVVESEPPEVAWIRIETTDDERIPAGPWLHFHYAQLELPPGARELARSPAGTAAFELGRHLGLQFHPEATREVADGWASAEAGTLAGLGIEPARLAAEGVAAEEASLRAAERLFDAWWERIAPPG
jgi:GMP synthase-like glutamine amidotransferase